MGGRLKDNLERTINFIMLHEGAKVHCVKGDRGGLTAAYGLTLSTMQKLDIDVDGDGDVDAEDVKLVGQKLIRLAFTIHFWDYIGGDKLKGGVDLILGDVAWNSGVGKARQFIREEFATDIERLTGRRKAFYQYQADNVPGQDKFLKGWMNRAEDARKEAYLCVGAA